MGEARHKWNRKNSETSDTNGPIDWWYELWYPADDLRFDHTGETKSSRRSTVDVYKMLNGFTNTSSTFFSFAMERHDMNTRAATNKNLISEKCHLDLRKYFFTNRIVEQWNLLPLDMREAESVNAFKNRYDDWTLDVHDQGNV